MTSADLSEALTRDRRWLYVGHMLQALWYLADGQPAEVAALQSVWYTGSVTRMNTVRIHARHTEWPTELEVEVWCSRVGASSWDMSQILRRRGVDGATLAEVVTTMVSVDASLTKAVPLPNTDRVRTLVNPPVFAVPRAARATPGDAPGSAMHRGAPPFSFERRVALVDTDAFGHVNNAKWSFLGCEAVHEACAGGWLGADTDPKALLSSVTSVRLDYVGQLTPKQSYCCTVTSDAASKGEAPTSVVCHFASSGGDPICTVYFDTQAYPAHTASL